MDLEWLFVVVGSYNGSPTTLRSWVSRMTKSIYAISLDNKETSAKLNKLILPLCLMEMEKVDDALDLIVCFAAFLSLVVIFWSLMLVLDIFSLASSSFLEVGAFLLTPTLTSLSYP